LLVFLHGKGEDQNSNLDDAMFAALARLGSRAPDVVFPYGGADSYWHDRADGAWGSYVVREVIPEALRQLHADPSRIAIGGISMGGFGALDIARLNRGRFCAVGGHSAALWVSGGDSAPGAFDDAQDFARHDVIGAARAGDPYPGAAVWIDVGTGDPFRVADTTLATTLRSARPGLLAEPLEQLRAVLRLRSRQLPPHLTDSRVARAPDASAGQDAMQLRTSRRTPAAAPTQTTVTAPWRSTTAPRLFVRCTMPGSNRRASLASG
jgi:hypothetical protein